MVGVHGFFSPVQNDRSVMYFHGSVENNLPNDLIKLFSSWWLKYKNPSLPEGVFYEKSPCFWPMKLVVPRPVWLVGAVVHVPNFYYPWWGGLAKVEPPMIVLPIPTSPIYPGRHNGESQPFPLLPSGRTCKRVPTFCGRHSVVMSTVEACTFKIFYW